MKLLTDNNELTKVFAELIGRYRQFHCCVAWAGDPNGFMAGKLLQKHAAKIKKVVVGLHFYQTHPNFIETFMDNSCVRFHIKSDGVFHDKIYLFSNSTKNWSAIIGSSNFTKGGFGINSECNVLISGEDDENGTVYKELMNRISKCWKDSDEFSQKMLNEYMACYIRQKGKRDSLGSIIKTKKREFDSSLLSLMTWNEYCAILRKSEKVDVCIDVLSKIQSLFRKYVHFRNMDETTRIDIAGFVPSSNVFAHFGTTKRNHRFGLLIKSNDEHISKVLDSIPLTGNVTFNDYHKYISFFTEEWIDPMATATRLLAMKRPDVFLCVNGANKHNLAKYLNIPYSRLTLENYWEEVIVPIHQSTWFKTHKDPDDGKEYWPYRVALLDTLIYEPR